MNSPNGRAHGTMAGEDNAHESQPPGVQLGSMPPAQFAREQINQFVAQLEVPFDASVIEWRVTNTSKMNGQLRGQIIPFADSRAYTDRLNVLFSPAGWTRRYAVHTSANFQRDRDQKTTAKVFVTCDVTIFGIGSHSATGEEWADNENAGTSAEAQAFKRACSCFGLGRYLYYFTGVWVDLDDRKRPKTRPGIAGWATPDGWRKGLRPQQQRSTQEASKKAQEPNGSVAPAKGDAISNERAQLIHQIEDMAKPQRIPAHAPGSRFFGFSVGCVPPCNSIPSSFLSTTSSN